VENAGVRIGQRWILRNVSFALPNGVCAAVIGPNGCGKSTLARVLSGYLWPTAGRVSVIGRTFGETDLHALRRRVRLVQPGSRVEFEPSMRAGDVVLTGAFGTVVLYDPPTTADRDRAAWLMKRLGIVDLASAAYGTLSTGERMRTLIARALLHPPALLLLDEPTAGLDLLGRELLLEGLDALAGATGRPERPTIMTISHHLEELPSVTDWAVVMRDGTVTASGAAQETLNGPVLSEAFGREIEVTRSPGGRFAARLGRAEPGSDVRSVPI
jgi:iron complex transport system ATP-binding protein